MQRIFNVNFFGQRQVSTMGRSWASWFSIDFQCAGIGDAIAYIPRCSRGGVDCAKVVHANPSQLITGISRVGRRTRARPGT